MRFNISLDYVIHCTIKSYLYSHSSNLHKQGVYHNGYENMTCVEEILNNKRGQRVPVNNFAVVTSACSSGVTVD